MLDVRTNATMVWSNDSRTPQDGAGGVHPDHLGDAALLAALTCSKYSRGSF